MVFAMMRTVQEGYAVPVWQGEAGGVALLSSSRRAVGVGVAVPALVCYAAFCPYKGGDNVKPNEYKGLGGVISRYVGLRAMRLEHTFKEVCGLFGSSSSYNAQPVRNAPSSGE